MNKKTKRMTAWTLQDPRRSRPLGSKPLSNKGAKGRRNFDNYAQEVENELGGVQDALKLVDFDI